MSISHTGMVYFGTEAKPYKETEVVKDSVVESVVKQFKDRSNVGIAKYGVTLDREDLSTLDWLNHAQQEAMDFCLYLEKLKSEYTKGWYDEKLEDRINIVGQNGNTGEHY